MSLPPAVSVSPKRLFAASSPFALPMIRHSADAEVLSLFSIIAVAYVFSCAVRCRSASCAWSSSVARMSTFTMLAVSKAESPYVALSPESVSRTATDSFAVSATVTSFIASASRASQSTEGSATGSTEASSLTAGDVEDDAEAADDDTRPGPSCACAFTYTVPAAVPPTRTAEATKV